MSLTLLQFPSRDVDIPAQLRALADEIANGDHGEIESLVVITRGDDFCLFSLGNADHFATMGLLTNAIVLLSSDTLA